MLRRLLSDNSESGGYQKEMQQRLDAFVGNRSFKVSAEMPEVNALVHSLTLVSLVVPQDTLTSDASQVMKIICDPEAAFADRPPRQGWVRIARSLCLHCSIVTAELLRCRRSSSCCVISSRRPTRTA